MTILITGVAGFIGARLAEVLLEQGELIIGVDNVNDYYDVRLKEQRLKRLQHPQFSFYKSDLCTPNALDDIFKNHSIQKVVHLAAQAGVRYSLLNPQAYINSNVVGFAHLLEACRHHNVQHLVFASSSSVYGANTRLPFTEQDNVDHPVALYAATKKSNELMAHSYAHLFNLPCTGLRLFTVYGPWGRPDMALFNFTRKILAGEPIDVYNDGEMWRDFTYIDDIVNGICRVIPNPTTPDPNWTGEKPDPATSYAPYRIYNLGNSKPIKLNDFIDVLENALNKKASRNYLPLQAGDVPATYADMQAFERVFGSLQHIPIEQGINEFVSWYKIYY